MTLQELYDNMDGDYEQAMRVLRVEKLLDKHIRKFVRNGVIEALLEAREEMKPEVLFDRAHAVKGISASLGLKEIAGMYREAVGSDESDEEILLKGERVWNLEKQFNIAAGVEKDTLPPRLLREALPEGPAEGKVNELHTMLKEYYAARGWTEEGIPTDAKLAELSLS